MTEWFKERYISREEHQGIVEYYRTLVAQLQVTVCSLRTRIDAQALENLIEHNKSRIEREARKTTQVEGAQQGAKVIYLDSRR